MASTTYFGSPSSSHHLGVARKANAALLPMTASNRGSRCKRLAIRSLTAPAHGSCCNRWAHGLLGQR
eukprot:3991769-Heterocapsa_arctica.AAC.1